MASAKEFVDSVAIRYAKQAQIAISSDAQAGVAVASEFSVTVANPASIEAAGKQQKEYLMKRFDALANHLEQNYSGTNDKVMESEAHQEATNARLDMMKLELDDDFITGVEPRFDPTKSRSYDSSWNWIREDLISLLTETHPEDSIPRGLETDERLRHILNRWDPTCVDVVEFYSSYSNATSHPRLKSIVDVLLHESMRTAGADPTFKYSKPTVSPKTTIDPTGKIEYEEIPRIGMRGSNDYSLLIQRGRLVPYTGDRIPYIHLRCRNGDEWQYHQDATKLLMDSLAQGCDSGLSFVGKRILITGAGPHSIGAEFYNSRYRDFGARGSRLRLLPFNQGSKKDCEALIEHIYSSKLGFGVDLDFIVPFAAIPEIGREIDVLDSKSELAHRLMLTNLLRLLGFVKQ